MMCENVRVLWGAAAVWTHTCPQPVGNLMKWEHPTLCADICCCDSVNIWKLPEFGVGPELSDDTLRAINDATVIARSLCGDVTLLDAAERVLARGAAAAALVAAHHRVLDARCA